MMRAHDTIETDQAFEILRQLKPTNLVSALPFLVPQDLGSRNERVVLKPTSPYHEAPEQQCAEGTERGASGQQWLMKFEFDDMRANYARQSSCATSRATRGPGAATGG